MSDSGSHSTSSIPSTTGRSMASLLIRFAVVTAILIGLLFIPAGRLDWWQGWLFVFGYTAFVLVYGLWVMRHDPALIRERSRTGPNVKSWDKVLMAVYTVFLAGLLVVAGLDAGRFRWAPAPPLLQAAGWLGLALAGALIWWATSVNTFLSSMVRIQDDRGQSVVTAGPYRWVRHPMYVGILIFMPCVALILGSTWALVPAAVIDALFVVRTLLEDRTLQAELPGYREYAERVRYRLAPGVW